MYDSKLWSQNYFFLNTAVYKKPQGIFKTKYTTDTMKNYNKTQTWSILNHKIHRDEAVVFVSRISPYAY